MTDQTTGNTDVRSKEMEIVVSQVAKMGYRLYQGKKAFEQRDLIKGIAIDALYVYMLEDQLTFGAEMDDPYGLIKAGKSVVVKSGLDWVADSFLKLGTKRPVMDYVMQHAISSGLIMAYDVIIGNITLPDLSADNS